MLVLWLLVLGRVSSSWVDPLGRNAISRSRGRRRRSRSCAPIRRLLPATGMIDFSPLILMLGPGSPPAVRLPVRDAVRFAVRLTPRGGADRVDGVGEDGALRVRVAAPPVEGAANEALCRLLARELGVAPGAVRIVAGASGRRKLVEAEADPPAASPRPGPGSTAADLRRAPRYTARGTGD